MKNFILPVLFGRMYCDVLECVKLCMMKVWTPGHSLYLFSVKTKNAR